MFKNLNLNRKISLFKLILSIFTLLIFIILSLSIITLSIRNDISISPDIIDGVVMYSLIIFVAIGGILFILYLIESCLNFRKYINQGKSFESNQYKISQSFESIVWAICITIIGIISVYYFRLSYVHEADVHLLLIFSIICTLFIYINVIFGSIFKLSNNLSNKKIKIFSISFILIFIILLSFIFMPLIQGIIYSPTSEKPNDFEMIMGADEFLNETPHVMNYNGDTDYKNNIGSSRGPPSNVEMYDEFYSPYYSIYDDNFIISITDSGEYPDYNNPNTNISKHENSVYTLFNNTQNNELEYINLYYQTNQESENNLLRLYSYVTKNNAYEALQNFDDMPDYFIYTTSLDNQYEINNSMFDINKYNESHTQPRGFETMNWIVTSVMISTGETEYYGNDVIVYENMWNQIYHYIPFLESSEVYIDKDTGAILKSNNNMESPYNSNYTVRPHSEEFEKPEFVNNFDGDSIDSVERKPFYDVNKSKNSINITLYGLSSHVRDDVEFIYNNQSKSITQNELKNYNPDNPMEFSFDNTEETYDIDVYFDGRYQYTINL